MSQRVDKTGQRTLAVVTKADRAPDGLLEKVTADDVNIGLRYVCVRNRIGDESYDDARLEEAQLFESHPLLSKIDKSIVGIPVLAQKLVQIQAVIISKCLPEIVRKINDKLNAGVSELNRMPQNLRNVPEAIAAFMQIIGLSKESLRKILMTGEFDEYPEDKFMHCTARLAEMISQFHDELQKSAENNNLGNFLVEEIRVLEESKGIGLPNFLPHAAFQILLKKKVNEISLIPVSFVSSVWDYIETVVINVLMHHSSNYPQLQSSTRRAAESLILKLKDKSSDRVMEIVEMEKLIDYTCCPEYMTLWKKLMASHVAFVETMNDHHKSTVLSVEVLGSIDVGHLRLSPTSRDQAFDLKMRFTAYWYIVLKRLVDSTALHLMHNVQKLVTNELELEIVTELIGTQGGVGIERMLDESPSVAAKREKLNKSIKVLRESKEVVARIMDRVVISSDGY